MSLQMMQDETKRALGQLEKQELIELIAIIGASIFVPFFVAGSVVFIIYSGQ